ncbi:MAG: ABC transporter substrate-binding protein [Bdellovibrionales bacterium]
MKKYRTFIALVAVQTIFTIGMIHYFRSQTQPEVQASKKVPPWIPGVHKKTASEVSEFRHSPDTVLIGYFHGGRTIIIYRTKIFDEFKKENLDVEFVTKKLGEDHFTVMPNILNLPPGNHKNLGKATGDELVALVESGELDGATIGETAFINAIRNGHDSIVAVAELGHDVKRGAGHALVLHKDIKVKGPNSLRGLKFGARRSSGGDEVVLREFLVQNGLDPDRDVKIVSDVQDDVFGPMIASRELDGGYGHVLAVEKWIRKYKYPIYIYRPLDWINPELSHSLLVFSRKYIEENRDKVQRIVRAYMRRTRHETTIPHEEKTEPKVKGLQIALDFEGLNLPEHRLIPKVQVKLLNEWQELLIKHKHLDRKVDLTANIDSSFVESAARELD